MGCPLITPTVGTDLFPGLGIHPVWENRWRQAIQDPAGAIGGSKPRPSFGRAPSNRETALEVERAKGSP